MFIFFVNITVSFTEENWIFFLFLVLET